jgi:RHS repeat-associated protein
MLVVQERHYHPHLSTNYPQRVVSYTRGRDLSGGLQGAGGIGGLLARTESEISNLQSASHAFYFSDNVGNVTLLAGTNGAVLAKYLYEPFGNLLSAIGPLAHANLYRFSSKEWHENSGLVYYGYRFYSPILQRWPSRDPIGERGGLNLYGFVGNDPIRRNDPLGLDYYIYIVKGTCGVNHRVLVGDDGNGNSYEIDIQPLAKKWYQSYRRVCGKGVISYTPRTGPATNWISGKLEKHGDTTPAQDTAMAAKAKSMDNASITYCLGIQDCRAIEDCLLWGPVGQRISDQLQLLWDVIIEQISPPR